MSSVDKPSLAVDNIAMVFKPSDECIHFRNVEMAKDYETMTIQIPLDYVGTITISSKKGTGGCEGMMPIDGCQDDISDCSDLKVLNSITTMSESIKKFKIANEKAFEKEVATSRKEGMKDNKKDPNNTSFESQATSENNHSYESSEQTDVDYELSQQQQLWSP